MQLNTMQGVRIHQFGGLEVLQLETLSKPIPAADELLIRVHSVGVLPVDCATREGKMNYIYPTKLPYIPHSAVSGVIEQVGENVTGFQKGQAVFGRASNGAAAEYITTTVNMIALKPEHLSFEAAATISGGATTAWSALIEQGKLQAGQRVLIHAAAGGVGTYAIQFAKWIGTEVIGTCSTENVEFVNSLGADQVIDYMQTRFEDVVQEVDFVLDAVGGSILERTFPIVKRGGTIFSLVESQSQAKAEEFGIQAQFVNGRVSSDIFQQIGQMVADSQLTATVRKEFPLHQIREAHQLSQTGHGRGRVILRTEFHPDDH